MDKQKLAEILLELKSSSQLVRQNPTDSNIRDLMDKYDMIFGGENLNCIYSHELAYTINNYFKIPVTIDELNNLIPNVCSSLNMIYHPMIAVSDIGKPNPKIALYEIIL